MNPLHLRKRPEDWTRRRWIRWRYLWPMPTRSELRSAAWQLREMISGRCGRIPIQGSGGYAHWRCGLRRWHALPHRYRNYSWFGPGTQVEYDPLPNSVQFLPPKRDGEYALTWPWHRRIAQTWRGRAPR